MPKLKYNSRSELNELIVKQVLSNDKFRKQLLSDPKKALADFIGTEFTGPVKVNVVVESPEEFYFVLPPGVRPDASDELSEKEMEHVAGGVTWPWEQTGVSNVNFFTDGICAHSCTCCG
jgi:hypothetical protein